MLNNSTTTEENSGENIHIERKQNSDVSLRTVETHANFSTYGMNTREDATRSVEHVPAGNMTLFNANGISEEPKYRSLSATTFVPQPNVHLENNFLKGAGPTMEPFELKDAADYNNFRINSYDTVDFEHDDLDSMNIQEDVFTATFDNETLPETKGPSQPPVKPNFIPFCGSHFAFQGEVSALRKSLSQVATNAGADFIFNEREFTYTLLTYPSDQKIEYSVQVYRDPNAERDHDIEFCRLQGPVLLYRNHLVGVWNELKESHNIGPGSNAKKMPNLNIDNNIKKCDYNVEGKTLHPMLKMATSSLPDVRIAGLQMLLRAVNASAAQDALKEEEAIKTTIEVLSSSDNIETDRCAAAVLREAAKNFHEDIIRANGAEKSGVDIVCEKLEKSLENTQLEILEVQRNLIAILKNLCECSGEYVQLLKMKGVGHLMSKVVKATKCLRIDNEAKYVASKLRP